MIDPGHGARNRAGGYEWGREIVTRDGTELRESDINRDAADALGKALEDLGYRVVYTRPGERVSNRADYVADEKAGAAAVGWRATEFEGDLFISLHHNSVMQPIKVNGRETKVPYEGDQPPRIYYWSNGDPHSKKLAGQLAKKLGGATRTGRFAVLKPWLHRHDRAGKDKNRPGSRPAVLMEIANMNSPAAQRKMQNPAWRAALMAKVAKTLHNVLKKSPKGRLGFPLSVRDTQAIDNGGENDRYRHYAFQKDNPLSFSENAKPHPFDVWSRKKPWPAQPIRPAKPVPATPLPAKLVAAKPLLPAKPSPAKPLHVESRPGEEKSAARVSPPAPARTVAGTGMTR